MKNRIRFFIVLCFVFCSFIAAKAEESLLINQLEYSEGNFYDLLEAPVLHFLDLKKMKKVNNSEEAIFNNSLLRKATKIGDGAMNTADANEDSRFV